MIGAWYWMRCKAFSGSRVYDEIAQRELLVAEYVSADLLRAEAMETGFREEADILIPRILRNTAILAAFARRILLQRDRSPWYLKQQALLFLASVADHSAAATSAENLAGYRMLRIRTITFPGTCWRRRCRSRWLASNWHQPLTVSRRGWLSA